MLKNRLKKILDSKPCTLLGVGPMSKNCVDVSIDIANKFEFPIMLIASRRQIDSDEFGGGYVNNWDTKSFASYVRNKDKKGYIMLARDHGGPWQNNLEVSKKLSLKDAMESAKRSYAEDIESGFEIIHIDPSIDIHSKPTTDQILDRVYELYDFCMKYAEKLNREILIEIGTEEQSGTTNTQEELEHTLISIKRFCDKNKFTQPTFVVIQTGTRVMEMQNIGTFDNPLRIKNEIPAEIQIPKMIDICNKHDIYMKEHNTDYLSNDSLRVHPRLGIHASNVAPEFGVEETKCFMKLLQENGLNKLHNEFVEIAVRSNKWKKWMLPDSSATKVEKALICGHYIFSSDQFIKLKKEAKSALKKNNINLDRELRLAVSHSILRYAKNFRLVS